MARIRVAWRSRNVWLYCNSSKDLLYTQTSAAVPSGHGGQCIMEWHSYPICNLHSPSIGLWHFTSLSPQYIRCSSEIQGQCERTTNDNELNMEGLNIDFGDKGGSVVSYFRTSSHPLTSGYYSTLWESKVWSVDFLCSTEIYLVLKHTNKLHSFTGFAYSSSLYCMNTHTANIFLWNE